MYLQSHSLLFVLSILITSHITAEMHAENQPPRFNFFDSNGDLIDLQRLAGETPVVISFFTTYCQPCRKELPFLQRQSKNGLLYKLVLVHSENVAETRLTAFLRTIGVTHPVIADRDEQIARKFGINKFPYTLYIGKSGKIIRTETGFQDAHAADLIKTLAQLWDL